MSKKAETLTDCVSGNIDCFAKVSGKSSKTMKFFSDMKLAFNVTYDMVDDETVCLHIWVTEPLGIQEKEVN